MSQYYHSFNQYLQERFGERVHRIGLNAGFNCPNIDGTLSGEGCIFCNNKAFSHFAQREDIPLEIQIRQSMEYMRSRFKVHKFIAYFQGFSSTYGDIDFLRQQYSIVRQFDDIVGLAISTRPDCIDEEKLDLIESFTKDYAVYIEYGLQTIHKKTLELINRNHAFDDFQRAVLLTAQRPNVHMGVHMILGLPGETREEMFITARTISRLPLWGIKFHCLHVVKDTLLAQMYNRGGVTLLSEDEYIDILINFLEYVPKEWVILRLVSDTDKSLLIAPSWINDKQRVLAKIEKEFKKRKAFQGRLHEGIGCKG